MRVIFVGKDRVVWKRLLLYILTFGISRRIWLYRVNKELDGHEALGLHHNWNVFLLCLPFLGPTVVTAQTAKRSQSMMADSPTEYGPWAAWYLLTWLPILGNLAFIGWTQKRLNLFWAEERQHPEHGIDIDVDLSDDPAFIIELAQAVKDSYYAGSRFDRKSQLRREAREARMEAWQEVQAERKAVRAAGGSTPVLPFLRPKLPPVRLLKVTCGGCQTHFEAQRDPLKETVLKCPKCDRTEVLASLRDDELAGVDQAVVATLKVDCPQCSSTFKVARAMEGPTKLMCPDCGAAGEVPSAA